MSRFIYSLIILFIFSNSTLASNFPFPQNVKYTYGIKPTNAKHSDALAAYNKWKQDYVVNDGPWRKRVLFDDFTTTVSEGIAYGMLLSAYANDSVVFNGLWRYYQKHSNIRGVMNWRINPDGTIYVPNGANGATDAEEDAAMALIIADQQWGSAEAINYLSDAKTLINIMMEYEVEKPSYVLKPGDAWGGSSVTNISYFAPAYYRIYYQITGDAQWLQVLNKCYEIINLNAHSTTGLVSDWCTASGTQSGSRTLNYLYDATRFPWRMATDYLWFGEPRAKDYCVKMTNFVKNTVGGPSKIVDGYTRSGAKVGGWHNSTFAASFALTGMVDPSFQTHLNASYTDMIKTVPNGYFDQMMQTLCLFVITGNFYRMPPPVCQTINLGPDISLCTNTSPTLDPQLTSTNRTFKWNTGQTTSSISVDKAGAYILQVDSMGCIRYDTVRVLGLDIRLGADEEIEVGSKMMLDAVTSGTGVTYLWHNGKTTRTIETDTIGWHWVQVDSAGCTDRDSIYFSYEESDKITLYPNPSEGIFKVVLLDATASKADIDVFNTMGKLVLVTGASGIKPGEPITLDLSNLATGMYIVRVKTSKAVKSKKVIIH